MDTYKQQRINVQERVNEFFGNDISIAPRAMAAFQGCSYPSGEEHYNDNGISTVESLPIFQELLRSSPACLALLFDKGIRLEKLFGQAAWQQGSIDHMVLQEIFGGLLVTRSSLDLVEFPLCRAAVEIQTNRNLDELHLLQSFFQTAYQGPAIFSEGIKDGEIHEYTSPLGSVLLDSLFDNLNEVAEFWDGEPGTYRAELTSARKFLDLANQISQISKLDPSHSDFQFALWLDSSGLIRVRPFGVGTALAPAPAFLNNEEVFRYRDGIFQPLSSIVRGENEDTLGLFESMINSDSCSESDFQDFFVDHPEILTGVDYRKIHPQLVLFNEDSSRLVPDFFLEPLMPGFCDILELKLPYAKLVRRLRNHTRTRFTALVNEAIAQLSEYRRYFESRENRAAFHKRYGLDAYYPKMILVIGRTHNFKSDSERAELRTMHPTDLQLWTYDYLLERARLYYSLASSGRA